MTTAAIDIHGLRQSYRDRAVLVGVDLTIDTGIVTASLGPNCAGKTTIVNILSTLLRPACATSEPPGPEPAAELLDQFDLVDAARSLLATYPGLPLTMPGERGVTARRTVLARLDSARLEAAAPKSRPRILMMSSSHSPPRPTRRRSAHGHRPALAHHRRRHHDAAPQPAPHRAPARPVDVHHRRAGRCCSCCVCVCVCGFVFVFVFGAPLVPACPAGTGPTVARLTRPRHVGHPADRHRGHRRGHGDERRRWTGARASPPGSAPWRSCAAMLAWRVLGNTIRAILAAAPVFGVGVDAGIRRVPAPHPVHRGDPGAAPRHPARVERAARDHLGCRDHDCRMRLCDDDPRAEVGALSDPHSPGAAD